MLQERHDINSESKTKEILIIQLKCIRMIEKFTYMIHQCTDKNLDDINKYECDGSRAYENLINN